MLKLWKIRSLTTEEKLTIFKIFELHKVEHHALVTTVLTEIEQGRYTFAHDTLLLKVVEAVKNFYVNIKEEVPLSPKSSRKFVKKGAKLSCWRSPLVCILHHASNWVILTDLHSNYYFTVHIAFSQLRPDITIFSNSLRKVILFELICSSGENMESWHST